MEKSPGRQMLMIVGGLIVGAVIWVVWGLPGIAAFSYVPTVKYEQNGTALFSVPADSTAVHVVTTADRVDPSSHGKIKVQFVIELAQTSQEKWSAPSLLMYGDFSKGLTACWSSDGAPPVITKNLHLTGPNAISSAEAALIEKNLFEPTANGGVTTDKPSQAQAESSANQAGKLLYTRVSLTSTDPSDDYVGSTWSYTPSTSAKRTFTTWKATFSCDFKSSAFWKTYGEDRVFNFPSVLLSSSNTASTGTAFGSERDVNVLQQPNEQYSTSTTASTVTTSNERNFSNHWYWWDVADAQLSNTGFSATYTDTSAHALRESRVLWAGLAGGVVATILIAVLKTMVDLALMLITPSSKKS
jgi:hypothetical protein